MKIEVIRNHVAAKPHRFIAGECYIGNDGVIVICITPKPKSNLFTGLILEPGATNFVRGTVHSYLYKTSFAPFVGVLQLACVD